VKFTVPKSASAAHWRRRRWSCVRPRVAGVSRRRL